MVRGRERQRRGEMNKSTWYSGEDDIENNVKQEAEKELFKANSILWQQNVAMERNNTCVVHLEKTTEQIYSTTS